MTDDGDRAARTAAAPVVFGEQWPSEERPHAEDVEEGTACVDTFDRPRLSALRQVEARRFPRERAVEQFAVANLLEDRIVPRGLLAVLRQERKPMRLVD